MSKEPLPRKRSIVRIIHKYSLKQQLRDIEYWRTQSFQARLAALEEIRREYHGWTDESQSRLARVYRIVKRR